MKKLSKPMDPAVRMHLIAKLSERRAVEMLYGAKVSKDELTEMFRFGMTGINEMTDEELLDGWAEEYVRAKHRYVTLPEGMGFRVQNYDQFLDYVIADQVAQKLESAA